MALVEVRNVSLRYDKVLVLDGVSLTVEAGESLAVLGPSGCGKTSLLRVLAGLETPEAGEVWFDGRRVDQLPVHQRDFGLMFQEFALFPHQDVAHNVEFGLVMQGMGRAARRARVTELLELVGLEGYGERRVHELSGGERQRVALARSLAPNPRLLMLDEPIGSLDRNLREGLLLELRTILRRLQMTSIYVTHDQDEALSLADRVMIMDRGHVRQVGRPEEIYAQPADSFVARFLGLGNLVRGRISAGNGGPPQAETALGSFPVPPSDGGERAAGEEVTLLLGDEQASLVRSDDASRPEACQFTATVVQRAFRGRRITFRLDAHGASLAFDVDMRPAHRAIAVDDAVLVTLEPTSIRVLPAEASPD